MIGRITGKLIEVSPPTICVQAGGIGYDIDVPMNTLYKLPALGAEISLYTHLAVREDAQVLYGFSTNNERSTFRQLIKVSGIGARTALAILSGMSVDDLANAIQEQESALLIKIPGIGKKTAERLLLELRDKLVASSTSPSSSTSNTSSDVINALLALGYSNNEARRAISNIPADLAVAESIRHALKALSKK